VNLAEGSSGVRFRLPATSANLGPAFDTAAVALDFHLDIEAREDAEFSIEASGRDAARCARLEDNLVLETYRGILRENGKAIVPLKIVMRNEIPLGMGCGSSAAGLLAAVALANDFGELGWSAERILEEACALEGHPDNAAACWYGGFVAAACEGRAVHYARVLPPAEWRAIVVLPERPLATKHARAVLPEQYSRADAVANIQTASLLGLAFAQGRGDLLRIAMRDRIHQEYRAPICPLLDCVLPLAGKCGILGAALSGAGPSVLAIVESADAVGDARTAIQDSLKPVGSLTPGLDAELLVCRFEPRGGSEI
jgi:homoserine kinase